MLSKKRKRKEKMSTPDTEDEGIIFSSRMLLPSGQVKTQHPLGRGCRCYQKDDNGGDDDHDDSYDPNNSCSANDIVRATL